jgi:hypothetical protein
MDNNEGVSPRRSPRLRHASADLPMQSRGLVPRIVGLPATHGPRSLPDPAGLPRGSLGFQLQHGRTSPLRRARLESRAGGLALDSENRNDPPGKPAAFCARGAAPG